MGMFDYVKCEYPLPDGWEPLDLLQTKDFSCELVVHVITADGRLMFEQIDDVVEVPRAERPYPNAPDGSLEALCGCIRNIKSIHESKFHGVLNFYGSEGDCNTMREPNTNYRWHEYNAKFTDGRLVEIVTARR